MSWDLGFSENACARNSQLQQLTDIQHARSMKKQSSPGRLAEAVATYRKAKLLVASTRKKAKTAKLNARAARKHQKLAKKAARAARDEFAEAKRAFAKAEGRLAKAQKSARQPARTAKVKASSRSKKRVTAAPPNPARKSVRAPAQRASGRPLYPVASAPLPLVVNAPAAAAL